MPKIGFKHSSETKEKMRLAMKIRIESGRAPRLGKKLNEEQRRIASESHMGIKMKESTKKKLSELRKGSNCNFWKGGVTANK